MSALSPLLLSWIGGAVLLGLDGRRAPVGWIAALLLALVLALDVWLLVELWVSGAPPSEVVTGGWPVGVGIRLHVDAPSLFFGVICALVLTVVLVHEQRSETRSRLFPALILLLSAGLHGAFFTGDLFNFYVFFELSVITSFVLAAYGYGRAELRGALVYVVVNLVGSVVFLAGVGAVYHLTGSLDLGQIAANDELARGLLVPAALLLIGMILKVGLFPLHSWVPVLYSHARPSVAAALAGALVNIGAYGLLRFGVAIFPAARAEAALVLMLLGIASVLYGSILAVARDEPAEIAAYLSITQAGYVVLAFGVADTVGIAAALLAMLSGSLEKGSMFLALASEGRARRAAAFIGAASAAGMPLTLGFAAKVLLFRAVLESPHPLVLTAAFTLASLLVLIASFRFWRATCASPPPQRVSAFGLLLGGVIVLMGALPEGATRAVNALASQLLVNHPP